MKKEELELKTTRDKTLRTLQKVQLEGLRELDRICRKNNIKYSLGGGTCLGQLRHGGFIPWDDDIDIDMTTENYEKFLEVAPKEMDSNRFFLRCYKTDKNWKRSFSRFEIKLTRIGPQNWDKIGLKSGIFIDLFEWNYLPNNFILRRIVTNSLFFIRWMQMYKMLNVYNLKPRYHSLMAILKRIIPTSLLFFAENKLKKCCGKRKTKWIIDNAVINGNHGGYLSEGIDEYEDVYFEDVKVMNKKNSHNFMRTIYGDNYMEWLPPAKRISHHNWYNLDFGIYSNIYKLPKDYNYYLTNKYNIDKIKQMKKVSLEMASDVHKICEENNLKYFVSNLDAYIKLNGVDDYGQYFRSDLRLAMPRNDFNKLAEIIKSKYEEKYFFQTNETEKYFKASYARLRLNYTRIREGNVPKDVENKFNNSFFITIIPLDNTSNDLKKRIKHARKLRYLNHFINLKWKNYNLRYFVKKGLKIKIKMLILLPIPSKFLMYRLKKVQSKYNKLENEYYIDSSSYQLDYNFIKKDILGKGKKLEYNGYELSFPEKDKEYIKHINQLEYNYEYSKIRDLRFVKEKYNDYYESMVNDFPETEINKVQKKFGSCSLTYYDIPDYQLSVLRYDEKKKKYLTNEEIINVK